MKFTKRSLVTIISIIMTAFLVGFGVNAYSTVTRPVKYAGLVNTHSEECNADSLLAMSATKVESNFDSSVKSKAGVSGPVQLMSDTAKSINSIRNTHFTMDDLKKPDRGIKMGIVYLSYLLHHFKNHDLAAITCGGGVGNVEEWLLNGSFSKDGQVLDDIPSPETKYYVIKAENQCNIYKIFYEDTRLKENMYKSLKV